jgi:hypothetical protein
MIVAESLIWEDGYIVADPVLKGEKKRGIG